MPRRKPKHSIQPGQVLNPNGRPVGSTNEINNKIKDVFAQLLANKLPELEGWLDAAAKRDPLKTADLLVRISERFTPALSRTEITGAEGQAFTPITINLPNIPKIDVATLNSGEATPIALPASSEEETPKPLGEGTASTDVDERLVPAFTLPKPVLSENQLRDLREMGLEPPERF